MLYRIEEVEKKRPLGLRQEKKLVGTLADGETLPPYTLGNHQVCITFSDGHLKVDLSGNGTIKLVAYQPPLPAETRFSNPSNRQENGQKPIHASELHIIPLNKGSVFLKATAFEPQNLRKRISEIVAYTIGEKSIFRLKDPFEAPKNGI